MPSQKILEQKKEVVSSLVSDFKDAVSFVFVDARGITVLQDTEMRAELRKNNIKYQVIKNTTSRFVFDEMKIEGLEETLKGPTAIAFSNDDIIAPAKILSKFAKDFDKLEIKTGILEGKVISKEEVNSLAKIPGKEVLYAQIAFGLNSPISKLAQLLEALRVKMEDNDGAVPASSAPATEAAPAEAVATAVEEAPAAEKTEETATESVETPAEESAPEAAPEETPAEEAASETTEE